MQYKGLDRNRLSMLKKSPFRCFCVKNMFTVTISMYKCALQSAFGRESGHERAEYFKNSKTICSPNGCCLQSATFLLARHLNNSTIRIFFTPLVVYDKYDSSTFTSPNTRLHYPRGPLNWLNHRKCFFFLINTRHNIFHLCKHDDLK